MAMRGCGEVNIEVHTESMQQLAEQTLRQLEIHCGRSYRFSTTTLHRTATRASIILLIVAIATPTIGIVVPTISAAHPSDRRQSSSRE